MKKETIYLAGGCLWGVQEFLRHIPGVVATEAGRGNGASSKTTAGPYDGYAECVKTIFDPNKVSVSELVAYLFEIIDPYSLNRQGPDVGEKYRTGIYSRDVQHLREIRRFIEARADAEKIAVEILPLENYVRSEDEHQDRLTRYPEDSCHLPRGLLHKYKSSKAI
jgi:peptide-methionine (S)-S-oxide reductase